MQMGVVFIGIYCDSTDPEEDLGVWDDCFGSDGFHGPVRAGYGCRDSIFGESHRSPPGIT